jgi:hypothetical protein
MSDGPEARKRREKERHGLVTARDQAVVEGNGSSESLPREAQDCRLRVKLAVGRILETMEEDCEIS